MAILDLITDLLFLSYPPSEEENYYDDPENISPAERVRRLQEKDKSKERSIEEEEQPADTAT